MSDGPVIKGQSRPAGILALFEEADVHAVQLSQDQQLNEVDPALPLSHLDRKAWCLPSRRAASSWVRPACRLASRRRVRNFRYLGRYFRWSSK